MDQEVRARESGSAELRQSYWTQRRLYPDHWWTKLILHQCQRLGLYVRHHQRDSPGEVDPLAKPLHSRLSPLGRLRIRTRWQIDQRRARRL